MYHDVIYPNMTSTLQITGCHFGNKPPGWTYPKHHHHLYEVLYCQEGKAKLIINDDVTLINPGDWFFIRSGTRHAIENASTDFGFTFFNIHFDLDDHEMRKRLSKSEYILFKASAAASTQLPFLLKDIKQNINPSLLDHPPYTSDTDKRIALSANQRIKLQAYILLIIYEILNIDMKEDISHRETQKDTTMYTADSAHLIEEKLQVLVSSDGTIAQIAEELNMSRSQCTKIFQRIYGVSPRKYLTQLKLNRAKEMLVCTNRTVEDIAAGLGFHSVSHFSRQFRRGTGMSPNQFRPRHMS
ncbi:AraC family transcriptional regulator [Neobacillus mesonae]|nr:AraC family transcriptional regulator [Neobacillus mesonae]